MHEIRRDPRGYALQFIRFTVGSEAVAIRLGNVLERKFAAPYVPVIYVNQFENQHYVSLGFNFGSGNLKDTIEDYVKTFEWAL